MDNNNKTTTEEYTGPTIRWDDITISQEAEHLPTELRESYRWLKAFARESCRRDLDILTTRFREVGVDRDKTTYVKLLRGRYQRDSHGRPLMTPLIAPEKLLQEIEALRSQTRIEAMKGLVPFVNTTTWHEIEGLITTRRDAARVNKFGLIVGPTGSQKTACLKEYRRLNNHAQTVLIEAPEQGRIVEFLRLLSVAYGNGKKNSAVNMRALIMERLNQGSAADRARRCIIVDNAQECWISDTNSDQPIFTFLRRLQDTTGCTIILSITPIFERRLMAGMIEGWFEQIEGRTGGRKRWLRLPEYAPDEDILEIAKAFGLRDAKVHLKELRAISREPGRIRRLFEDLQEGKLLAGKGEFTMEHIREIRGES